MKSVLVTGASGFLGQALLQKLADEPDYHPIAGLRYFGHRNNKGARYYKDLSSESDLSAVVRGVSVVIHCAARVHMMQDSAQDPLAAFREVNTVGTMKLARAAAAAGVKRFVFISSIKVNGEHTLPGLPFAVTSEVAPSDPYGISKAEAEQSLMALANETGMEVVIIRPPLIYGPNVKGNFASLLRLVERGVPLPLGRIYNKRSLVALDNLVDLIITCISHPAAANQCFLVSDDQDVSTTQLLQLMAVAARKPVLLLPVPVAILRFCARLAGKQAEVDRLCGDLQVDISHTKATLGWRPPLSVQDGLARCFQD
jgi:nucleoside-diphosphate-sugar epimerase